MSWRAPRLGWMLVALLAVTLISPARAADTVVYYHTDALRSVAVVTNAQGQVLERTHYAPYGQVLDRPLRDGPGYGGHEEDAATGLVYMQQRYYCSECGRFLSADPVQVDPNTGANFNRYWYANDNPYRYTDPDGRQIVAPIVAGCAITPGCKALVAAGVVALGVAAKKAGDAAANYYDHVMQSKQEKAKDGSSQADKGKGNSNPYNGPVDSPVTVVDSDGNAIPVNKGEQIGASPDGKYQQVKDHTGKPTGTRLDKGGHSGHADPKAQAPHAHSPGVTDATGNPHLPVQPPKPPKIHE